MSGDVTPSLIRTAVPLIVGPLVTWAASKGLDLDGTAVTAVVTSLAAFLYYAVARLVERRWPRSRPLVSGKQPVYPAPEVGS